MATKLPVFQPYEPPAFVNSMQFDNEPSNEGSENNGVADDRFGGGPERTAKVSPLRPETLVAQGPLPPDPNALPGDENAGNSTEISDMGIKDSEIGRKNGSIHQYGLTD